MGDFFDSLKNNLNTLELKYLTTDYMKFLNGENSSRKKDDVEGKDNEIKPSGTVAFLHGLRAYRPTNQIRALVAMEPEAYRGSNYFDPSYQWTGLGK